MMAEQLIAHGVLLLACVGGFAALALGMARHQKEVLGAELSAWVTRGLRGLACLLLLSAWGFALGRMGWGAGWVSYAGHISLGAACVYLGLIVLARLRVSRNP